MNYLYGDSSPSPLRSNFLEFLRDSLDFCVHALETDTHILRTKERLRALRDEAEAEGGRLETFVHGVTRAIDDGPKGAADSPTARCAEALKNLAADALRSSLGEIRAKVAEAEAKAETEERTSRAECVKALEALLVPHEPPGASTVTAIDFAAAGTYEAQHVGETELGLAWTLRLAVPDQHAFATSATVPLRADRFARDLEIHTPQLSGWISKEVKIRPQKIERHVISRVVDDGRTTTIRLRAEPGSELGFDVEARASDGVVRIAKVGPEGDATTGPFDLEQADTAKLLELSAAVRASLQELQRVELMSATFDDVDFADVREFREVVERLVGVMTPIVREIDQRSLTPTELVIRRLLANDRREEIFVAKSALREKYAALPPAQRAVFAPLGLEPAPTNGGGAKHRSKAPPEEVPPPAVRTQLAPSQPPPPLSSPATVGEAVVTVAGSAPPPAFDVPPPPSLPSLSTLPSSPSIPSLAAFVEESARVSEPPGELGADGSKTSLKATLKRILALAKKGATDDAYRGYATLFASPEFAAFRPEDRRQALKIMVLAKTPPPPSEAVVAAHKAALTRATELVATLDDPADYEILGVTQTFLDDEDSARATFAKALSMERERNPSSELCGNLMRRLSQTSPPRKRGEA